MPHWITTPLVEKLRKLFESKYQRQLSDEEVFEIADNLTEFLELVVKYNLKIGYK